MDKDGIWIIDAQAKTMYANDRMAEILGTITAEMIGHAATPVIRLKNANSAI